MDSKVTAPLRLGLSATRATVGFTSKLAFRAAGGAITLAHAQLASRRPSGSGGGASPRPPDGSAGRWATPASTAPPAGTSVPADARVSAEAAAPEAQAASEPAVGSATATVEVPSEPPTPITRQQGDVKTIDDRDEVVAEFADPGAEDGAGASLELEPPWSGYDGENAGAITSRIATADAAEVAVIELYERAHKARKTVLAASARRLAQLDRG